MSPEKPSERETGDALVNAPVAAEYEYGRGMNWRVRRYPKGAEARIEFAIGPVKVSPTETIPGGEYLWAADVLVDADGFFTVKDWNHGPGTWDSRAATLGRAQQELMDQEYRAALRARKAAEQARKDAAAVEAMPRTEGEASR